MAVYDASGEMISAVYDGSGVALPQVYKKNGDKLNPIGVPLTIMTFNVGCFYSEYHPAPTESGTTFYTRHKGIFDKYHPDFAGLSEWFNVIGIVQSSKLMGECFKSYYPNYDAYPIEGAALTSAFAETPSSVETVAYTTQDTQTRYYQKSYVTFGGKTVCCILTHLSLTTDVRAAQLLELLSVVENEEYFIVTGDFNFEIVSIGDSEYNASIQTILDSGYNSAQNAEHLFKTWFNGTTSSSGTQYALDNIFTSSNITIVDVVRDETKFTDGLNAAYNVKIDHVPLVAHVLVT